MQNLYEPFKINSIKENKIAEQKASDMLDNVHYLNIENKVIENITKQRDNKWESNKYDDILNKCVLGDKGSINQVKGFINNYLLELTDNKDFVSLSEELNLDEDSLINALTQAIFVNNYGLGAIDDLVADKSINEIWVNGYNKVFIEKQGFKELTNKRFKNNDDVIRVMNKMLQFGEKEISRAKPRVESKLSDGSRITFIVPPVAKEPYMNIRKFQAFNINEENILAEKEINEDMLLLIKLLMKCRANILVIGEPSSGKTSFLKFMCGYIDKDLRIGTIETDFELKLQDKYPDKNIFEYEEHEELGVTLEDLLRTSLRSSPDVMVLGEARGGSDAEVLVDAASRIECLGTLHVNSASETIDCLVNMILNNSSRKKEPMFVKNSVINNFDFIIELKRIDNKRKVSKITQIIPHGEYRGEYILNDIFTYDKEQDTFTCDNKILSTGKFKNKLELYCDKNEANKFL